MVLSFQSFNVELQHVRKCLTEHGNISNNVQKMESNIQTCLTSQQRDFVATLRTIMEFIFLYVWGDTADTLILYQSLQDVLCCPVQVHCYEFQNKVSRALGQTLYELVYNTHLGEGPGSLWMCRSKPHISSPSS
jgi:hypothetical protein